MLRSAAVVTGALVALYALPAAAQIKTEPLTPSQDVAPAILVARIDANCGVFRDAIKTQPATTVAALASRQWAVIDASKQNDVLATHANVWVAQVWKQAGNYVWVHSNRFDTQGNEHATQLCFRNDGTLARVRQATALPDLDAAGARAAYFNTDGSLIQADALFEKDDPAIAKQITAEPFMKPLI